MSTQFLCASLQVLTNTDRYSITYGTLVGVTRQNASQKYINHENFHNEISSWLIGERNNFAPSTMSLENSSDACTRNSLSHQNECQ